MTDNEIIKALGRCPYQQDCVSCNVNGCDNSPNHIMKCTLDLINRQKAEIENFKSIAEHQQSLSMDRYFEIKRLTERLEKRTTELDRLTIYFDKAVEEKLKTAKTETITVFAYGVIDEIDDAIHSNYNAIEEREKKYNVNRYEDDLCLVCDGKISAMLGIRTYIFNTMKEMAGETE